MHDLLSAIVAGARANVAGRRALVSCDDLIERLGDRRARGGLFTERIRRPGTVNVIAECKRRSPAKGVLRADYDPSAIATGYEAAGCAAISVLTEPSFFDGSLEHLRAVRAGAAVPLLRKDFVVDEYQLLEAVDAGADAALLIVAALDDRALTNLSAAAGRWGLSCLVEVHDAHEAARAVDAGATVIGVNSRNLRTLDVDLETFDRVRTVVSDDVTLVAESGIRDAATVRRLRALGYSAFLIGEWFMRAPVPGHLLRQLIREAT